MDNNSRQEIQLADYEFGPQQEINLREYWDKLRRRKVTVFSVALAVVALGGFWTFTRKPVYTAKSTLLIEKEPNILSFEQVLQIESTRDDYYQTQYRLLESRGLAENVIDRLELFKKAEFIGPPEKRKKPVDPLDHVFREGMVDAFLRRLSVRPVRLTRLVEVSFDAHDPKLAADCVNELAKAFIDLNIDMRYAATEQATQFLGDQIKTLQAEVERKGKELQDLEAEANIVALSDNETTVIEQLGAFNKALTEAQIDRVRKEALWSEVRNVTPDYVPEALNNPLIQGLRQDYVKLKRDFQQMEDRFQPDYPELQRLKAQVDAARSSLEAETQNLVKSAYSDFQAALKNEKSLEAAFNAQKNAAFRMNSSAVLYSGLKVEIENKKTLLDSLLRRQSETGVEARLKGLGTSNVRIVDRARVPVRPSSPNKRRNMALALVLGLAGGIGLAFMFEFLDNTIKTSEDVDRCAGLPTLGIVPKFSLNGTEKGYLYYRRRKAHEIEGRKAGVRKLEAGAASTGGAAGADGAGVGAGAGSGPDAGSAEGAEGGAGGAVIDTTTAGSAATGSGIRLAVRGSGNGRGGPRDGSREGGGGRGKGRGREGLIDGRSIELVPHYFPNSRLSESYRSIRTALLLSSADRPVKAVAVSSALPGEGKTVSVANLGITLAQSGKTVLLVDADLRRPRQHRIFKVKNTFGLTTYLTDSVELKNVIKPTNIANLFLVNAGPIPPNPAELLGSEKMGRFIAMMREECDYILFDTPPMLDISDALVVGARIDGVVMVVHGDKTSREVLKKASEKLEMLKVRTLGVIINNVDVQRQGYHYCKDYYYR